jgi:hypothetical protein
METVKPSLIVACLGIYYNATVAEIETNRARPGQKYGTYFSHIAVRTGMN